MDSITNQLKRKAPEFVSVFYYCNLLQVHWKELLFYVSLHPNTMINFRKTQTNFIGLLWQLCFSRVHL